MVKLQERLDRTFRALSDQTRRAMLARLRQSPCSVNELAAPFDMSLAAVSKHLKVLEQAQLVSRTRSGRKVIVRLTTRQLGEASQWLGGVSPVLGGKLGPTVRGGETTRNTIRGEAAMNEPPVKTDACALHLTQDFNISPEELFDYFTRAERLTQWFAPDASLRTEVRTLELKVGGRYELAMINDAEQKNARGCRRVPRDRAPHASGLLVALAVGAQRGNLPRDA